MNKKKSEEAVIFVAGILERVEGNTKKIFIQTRWKPNISPIYSGLLEVPGGRVDSHENVFDAIIREVKEECGLDVKAFRSSFRGESFSVDKFEETVLFQPFVCQQVLNKNDGRLWFGFFFICEVVGEARIQEGETKDPRWVDVSELEKLLVEQPEKFFPHQYQALKYYVDSVKKNKSVDFNQG